ncbi:hypothetical protein EUGRSUZ_D02419 [Eucalyptus grandis]|uniref:Uncharacterized protein n=2 Tax=Eucalyptus grandis TaxID=71139 RepID=A0ACC3L842_EUCGR|nr:hypothetical protein EUGRSUZ_D02419 [Eucalyptus grandis]
MKRPSLHSQANFYYCSDVSREEIVGQQMHSCWSIISTFAKKCIPRFSLTNRAGTVTSQIFWLVKCTKPRRSFNLINYS